MSMEHAMDLDTCHTGTHIQVSSEDRFYCMQVSSEDRFYCIEDFFLDLEVDSGVQIIHGGGYILGNYAIYNKI